MFLNLYFTPTSTVMKNKLITVLLMSVLTSSLAFSQIKFGLRGGINSSKMNSSTEVNTGDYKITCPNYSVIGYHVGLISQINLFAFFIQPELLYSSVHNDLDVYELNSANPDEATTVKQTLNRIDIPVMVGFKLKILKLEVGPVASFIISDNSDLESITQYDMQWNKATIGYQAGIGLDVGKIALDVKYEGSLSKLGTGITIGNTTTSFDTRLNQIIVSVGLFFN
jgi:hypothetical protein